MIKSIKVQCKMLPCDWYLIPAGQTWGGDRVWPSWPAMLLWRCHPHHLLLWADQGEGGQQRSQHVEGVHYVFRVHHDRHVHHMHCIHHVHFQLAFQRSKKWDTGALMLKNTFLKWWNDWPVWNEQCSKANSCSSSMDSLRAWLFGPGWFPGVFQSFLFWFWFEKTSTDEGPFQPQTWACPDSETTRLLKRFKQTSDIYFGKPSFNKLAKFQTNEILPIKEKHTYHFHYAEIKA